MARILRGTDPVVQESRDPRRDSQRARSREIQRVLWITLWLNLAVCAAKAVYGVLSGSLAIASDAIHSLVDGASNVLGLVVTHFAAAPPDRDHPYGHRKLEIIAASGIGVAIGAAAVRFMWSSLEALITGTAHIQTSRIGFVIIGATMVVNIFVATYEARRARELASPYLAADAAHTASDVVVTAAVLVSFAAAHAGVEWADPVGALLVIAVVARVAWKILSNNLAILMDGAVIDTKAIESTALTVPGVHACHRVRSRGSSDAVHLDLHLLLDGDLSLRRAHVMAHEVEKALRARFPELVDVIIHMEPQDEDHHGSN